jgi:hypothetical protein
MKKNKLAIKNKFETIKNKKHGDFDAKEMTPAAIEIGIK